MLEKESTENKEKVQKMGKEIDDIFIKNHLSVGDTMMMLWSLLGRLYIGLVMEGKTSIPSMKDEMIHSVAGVIELVTLISEGKVCKICEVPITGPPLKDGICFECKMKGSKWN